MKATQAGNGDGRSRSINHTRRHREQLEMLAAKNRLHPFPKNEAVKHALAKALGVKV